MQTTFFRTILGAMVLGFWIASPGALLAQGAAPPPQAPAAPVYSAAQLDRLLAPIALYPDTLVGNILMASTYPLEVIEAYRWLQEKGNASLKGDQLDAALQEKDWDPSVKSLLPFPQVLRMMNDRLDWMQQVGDAFLAQQADVMDSVQRLRRAAENSGNLRSSPQQTVTTEDQDIVIAPANPDQVYVPVYDPTVVYGVWPYPAYPPYYYWPPEFVWGPAYWPGWWWWWPAIVVSFYDGYWGWGHCDWHNHSIYVDYRRYDRIAGHRPPSFSGNNWQHDTYHRRGVAYRNTATAARYGRPVGSPDARRSYRGYQPAPGAAPQGGAGGHPPTVQRGTSGRTPGAQPPSQPGAAPQGRTGSQLPTVQRGTSSVQRPPPQPFGGYGSGADARAQSERGRASQQTITPRAPSPSVSAPRPSVSAPRPSGVPSGGGMRAPSGGGSGGGRGGSTGGGGAGGHR